MNNLSLNSDKNESDYESMNIFLVNTNDCRNYNDNRYCVYSALLVTFGHLLYTSAFFFILLRINRLQERFRNQYNLSFLWLLSILSIAFVDLLEYTVSDDVYLYSKFIILLVIVQMFLLLMIIYKYLVFNYIHTNIFWNFIMKIIFTIVLFVLLIIGRLWSSAKLSKFNEVNARMYRLLNTHTFMYFFVYIMFGCVQLYANVKNNFARCLTNSSYALWIIGAFFQLFYASLLPASAQYEIFHYRNYFLYNTILVVLVQDCILSLEKLSERRFHLANMKQVSMREFKLDANGQPVSTRITNTSNSSAKNTGALENAFQADGSPDDNEEDVFDLRVYNGQLVEGAVYEKTTQPIVSISNAANDYSFNTSDLTVEEIVREARHIYIFLLMICLLLVISHVSLFKSVTFSFITVLMILVQPVTIVVSLLLKRFSYI